jgi:hypothetical protein
MDYTLNQLSPGIFYIEVEDQFDLSLFFLRIQECFESPYKNIKGKNFTLLEFMKTYSKDRGNDFTYVTDWAGFNVSGKLIDDLYNKKNISKIRDFNPYDEKMAELHEMMCRLNEYEKGIAPKIINLKQALKKPIVKYKDRKTKKSLTDEILFSKGKNITAINNVIHKERFNSHYYLIGALPGDTTTLKHELCHAFFNLYTSYKADAYVILSTLSDSITKKANKWLSDLGYCKEVLDDELQAYLTFDWDDLIREIKFTKKEEKSLLKASDSLRSNFYKYIKPE